MDDELYEQLNEEYDRVIHNTLIELAKTKGLTKQKFIQALLKANKVYWIARLAKIDEYTMLTAKKTAAALTVPYMRAANEYLREFRSIYGNFQSAFNLSQAEANRLLANVKYDKTIMQNLQSIANMMPDGEDKDKILATISAPAYRYRLERVEVMQKELKDTCNSLASAETNAERAVLQTEVERTYNITFDGIAQKQPSDAIMDAIQGNTTIKSAANMPKGLQEFDITTDKGILDSFHAINERAVKQIVNRNWSGESFSSRIWEHTDELSKTVKDVLLNGELTGASVNKMAGEIKNRFNVAAYQARRLVRTEINYVQNQATLEEYKDAGIERYEFGAFLDDRTSEICEEHNGHIYNVKDAKVGVNCPPMHPNCRSIIMPVVKTVSELDEEYQEMINSLDVPAGENPLEWLANELDKLIT
jgi:SPP1 gp7 family putative phage head morphogenesis protein